MILLDTNVISEPLRPKPDPKVIAWIDAQPLEALYVSAITLAELRAGVALLPAGKRKESLNENLETQVLPLFANRILAFDQNCSQAYAELIVKTRHAGFSISAADAYIAAIAITHDFSVATRDTGPFDAAGVTVINPWLV